MLGRRLYTQNKSYLFEDSTHFPISMSIPEHSQ